MRLEDFSNDWQTYIIELQRIQALTQDYQHALWALAAALVIVIAVGAAVIVRLHRAHRNAMAAASDFERMLSAARTAETAMQREIADLRASAAEARDTTEEVVPPPIVIDDAEPIERQLARMNEQLLRANATLVRYGVANRAWRAAVLIIAQRGRFDEDMASGVVCEGDYVYIADPSIASGLGRDQMIGAGKAGTLGVARFHYVFSGQRLAEIRLAMPVSVRHAANH